jgi:hypothetical protein
MRNAALLIFLVILVPATAEEATLDQSALDDAIVTGVDGLIELQDDDGAWPYEGVYRVGGKIPVGYRIGGTAICCEALMYATAAGHEQANTAISRGVDLILAELEDPRMEPSKANRYDVRIWGHIYALDLFCRLMVEERFEELHDQIAAQVTVLTQCVIEEEIEAGGWNYANRDSHAAFVTAPAVQSLLWAKQIGEAVDDAIFLRSANALQSSHYDEGGYAYSGKPNDSLLNRQPGSIARTAASEITLQLIGSDRRDQIAVAIEDFHKHWDELEKRRKKTGTHKPPYGVAPYYFYYGHRYLAQAIEGLPEDKQRAAYERFNAVLMKTRDGDGTWNDRVFEQSRTYGTAMAVLALLGDRVPLPNGKQL